MGTTGGMGAGLQGHQWEATHGYYWGSGGGDTGALVGGDKWVPLGEWGWGYRGTSGVVGGDTWVLLGEWGWGYRGTSGRRHMGTNYYLGNGGGATGALVE